MCSCGNTEIRRILEIQDRDILDFRDPEISELIKYGVREGRG